MILNIPLNSVSFGQVGFNICNTFHNKGLDANLIPVHNPDFSSFLVSEELGSWFNKSHQGALERYNVKDNTFRLWHINGSEIPWQNGSLMTFHELSEITKTEKNILSNWPRVLVTSHYTKRVFEEAGLNNVEFCPLGFDELHFKKKDKEYLKDKVVFGLFGKLEKRKRTVETIIAWCKLFADNPKYRLHCHVTNPFIAKKGQDPFEVTKSFIVSQLGGRKPWNVDFFPHCPKNSQYNECLNVIDVVLGLSGGEGWGLPEFQALCLGKHAVMLNAHSYMEFASESNSVLVEPSGKVDSVDGIFFQKGLPFNQGEIYTWNEEEVIEAMKKVLDRAGENNIEGEKLKKKFTWDKTLDVILRGSGKKE